MSSVRRVEGGEVAPDVGEEAHVLDRVGERRPGVLQDAGDPGDDGLGLRRDVPRHGLARRGIERDLTRDEHQVANPHRLRVRQAGRRHLRARDHLTRAHWILPRAAMGQMRSTTPRRTHTYSS